MEETNYDRPLQVAERDLDENPETTQSLKVSGEKKATTLVSESDIETGRTYKRKSFFHKLSIWPEGRPNRLLPVMWGPIRFFSYPVVVYAGLMYGANGLVWSSILNATAGTLYPQVYGFSTAGIAGAYLSGCVGVIIGLV
jgi:hypothetical protein